MTSEIHVTDAPPHDLHARSKAWTLTGNPAALWPDLDLTQLPLAAAAIERSVTMRLAGERSSLGAPDGHDADAIGVAGLISGTGPLLGYWIEQGMLDASVATATVLARHLDHNRRRMARMTQEVLPALTALIDNGITPIILKGFHTGQTYFPAPGLRPLADIDLLIDPTHGACAEHILRHVGFTPEPVAPTPYKRDWYPPDMDTRIWSLDHWDARNPWKLEVHHALDFADLKWYGVHLDATAPATVEWNALGIPLQVIAQPLRFVIQAMHFAGELTVMRLLRLVEMTWMIRQDLANGTLDWTEVEAVIDRSTGMRFMYPAFAMIEQLAPETIDPKLLDRARSASTRVARAVVARYTPGTPVLPQRTSMGERMMWPTTPFQVLRRLWRMIEPPRRVPLSHVLRIYRARLYRLFTGHVSLR